MSLKSVAFALAVSVSLSVAHAQAWKDAYERGLSAAHEENWAAAHTGFQEAIAVRPEDQSSPTILPGPPTEPIKWKSGSPYSPNFGLAYVSFKMAQKSADADKRALLVKAAEGFETLLAKNQASAPTLFFLNEAYGQLGQPDKQREIGEKIKGNIVWRVDTSIMTPEETAQIASVSATVTTAPGVGSTPGGTGPKVTIIDAGSKTTIPVTSLAGPVPVIPSKFALIIGNSETQMSSGGIPFAASDAIIVRDALVQNAGYGDKNVEVVVNATADQIRVTAQALADRIAKALADKSITESTLVIYFSGIGVNVDGKDYYAGVDAAMSTDTSKMIAKEQILSMFRNTGSKFFVFDQANRPIVDGRYFGRDVPIFGRYSLSQATSPGDMIYGAITDGKLVGAYTKAFADVLAQYRSNKVPVYEFSWAVFNSMKGGDVVRNGGGTKQVPCLPVLNGIAQDDWF